MRIDTRTLYICEKCGTAYNSEIDALACENRHIVYTGGELSKSIYSKSKSIYPDVVYFTVHDDEEDKDMYVIYGIQGIEEKINEY